MLLALDGVRGEAGRQHRIARAEPPEGEQEQTREEEGRAEFRESDRRTRPGVDGRNDLEVPLASLANVGACFFGRTPRRPMNGTRKTRRKTATPTGFHGPMSR